MNAYNFYYVLIVDIEYILKNTAGNLYWKDINGKYCGANQAFTDLMNARIHTNFIGKTDREIFSSVMSDEKLTILERTDQRIMQTDREECLREEGVNIEGKKAFYLTKKIPLHDDNGQVNGIMGTSLDITKEMQAEIAKRNFLSNMEHDLRTPFAGIGGVADLLATTYAEKYPELKELFELMTKSCTQWQEIHNRIFDALDLRQELKIESFYIQDELEKVKDLMGSTSKVRNIPLYLDYPAKESTGMVETDILKFKLILSSLVGNAFNFTEKGSVTIKLRKEEDCFYLDIIDTGIGIPKDKLETIFEEFTKLSPSNKYGEIFKGMGLGLYNAHRDAEKIKASIQVKSEVGKGSTFTLKLPAKLHDI